jgi:hypothetical protein
LCASARLLSTILFCIFAAGLVIPSVAAQTAYSVSITIAGLPPSMSTNVYVDGGFNGTLSGGQTHSFAFSASNNLHFISLDSYVPNSVGNNGTRYFTKDPTWSFSAAGNHLFTYTAQYYLTVRTNYSSSTGQGWYDSGTAARATLKDAEVDEGQGTRQIFTGWVGDTSGTDLVSNDISMTGPKVAIANWKTQFFLTVESDPPNVSGLSGSGWYDSGNQAAFSAAAFVPATQNTRLRFDHWSGDYTSQSATGHIAMDRAKTVKAGYLAQYFLVVQYDPASISSGYNETHAGWFDANSNVQLGPAPANIDLSSVERLRFVGWVDNGSTFSSLSYAVVMDQPRTITLSYRTQYYVDVRSSQGAVSGSGWYDRGSTARITGTAGSQTWPFSYSLTGWRLDPSTGKFTKTDDSWILTVDGPYVVEAEWSLDYVLLIGLFGGGAVAIAGLAVGFVLAYRRGIFSRGGPIFRPPKPRPMLGAAMQICGSCGNRVPKGATFCEKCGAPLEVPMVPSSDDRVYDYIVKHEGVISLSTASTDLGIPVEELKEITERLKKQGRLG